MARRLLPASVLVLALVAGIGCNQRNSPADAATAAPGRIVSLSPALTEILFAVGAGDRVVGVTDYCDWPPEARERPRVGGFANPSVESVIALRPDLVFASPGPGNRDPVRAMERAGLRVAIVESETLPETLTAIREVARAAGVEANGEAVARRIESRIAEVSRRVAGRPRVRTLFCLQVEPIVAVGRGTLPSQLLEAAGGENVVADERYPRLGIESVIALDPEVVLQSRMDVPEEDDRDAGMAYWRRWPDLAAVRGKKVRMLPGSAALRPGPRVADAVEEIASLLHGGVGEGASP